MPVAGYIDASGITVPTYQDILDFLTAEFRGIYGADVVLTADTLDGQWLATLAQAANDLNSFAVAVYNSRSPVTAQGSGLSSLVKLNGITRAVPSFSMVDVRLVGQANTQIIGGAVTDVHNNRWILPPTVLIPDAGEILVTATAEEAGAIGASVGTVTTIATPTRGWQSVTNPSAATPGLPLEGDADLRIRQAASVSLPSRTVLDGIFAAIALIPGVARVAAYENDTNQPDSRGIPAHSIAMVVQGGDVNLVAQAIQLKKAPGAGTHGTTLVQVADFYGIPTPIRFFRPTLVSIQVEIDLIAVEGYHPDIGTRIRQSVARYINALAIGTDIIPSRLHLPANLWGEQASGFYMINGLRVSRDNGPSGVLPIPLAINELATAYEAEVTLNVS